MADDPKKNKPGPEADRLKIDGDWEDAMRKAMNKPKPDKGWPDPPDDEADQDAEKTDDKEEGQQG